MGDRQSILFLCTTNSCRSQMAEGMVRHQYGDRFEVHGAGAESTTVHPLATKVMYEVGIDISQQRSKTVEEFLGRKFDYVITLCGENAKDVCPAFPGEVGQRLVWSFTDPAEAKGSKEEVLGVFREVRDEIGVKIDEFAVMIETKRRL